MQFRCPDCGREYTGSDQMIGGRARCAECRNTFIVTPNVKETAVADSPVVEFAEDEPLQAKWQPRPAVAEAEEPSTDLADSKRPRKSLTERLRGPRTPDERRRYLCRYLTMSVWALRIVTVLGIVGGVVAVVNAHSTYQQVQSVFETGQQGLNGLQGLVGPIGGLGGLGGITEMAAPSPWTFYALPIVTIVGSILMYLMGMLVIYVVRVILDMEENTRRLIEELEARGGESSPT